MRLEVSCKDRLGITQDVLDILVDYEIDLRGIEIDEAGKIFLNFPNIEFNDFQHLMPKLRLLDGIVDVKTTPFMPTEREQYQLQALLQTLPDPVFSVDTRGDLLIINESAVEKLSSAKEDLIGTNISELLKGYNILRWLESNPSESKACRVKFTENDYLLDMLPVLVPNQGGENVFAGAVFLLKSEIRLEQQLTVFHQIDDDSFQAIQASSKPMKLMLKEAKLLCEQDGPLLIFGETGSGKKTLAKACHLASKQKDRAFNVIHCFGLSVEEFKSQLSAEIENKQDATGTLLLTEVGDLSLDAQGVLLQLIDKSLIDIRSSNSKKVKLICTTQKDLNALIHMGEFRVELFHRLSEFTLIVPPLRERKADIIKLTEQFIVQHCLKLKRDIPTLTADCLEYLQAYPWQGNIRQLSHVLYKALSLLEGAELNKAHIHIPTSAYSLEQMSSLLSGTLEEQVKKYEKDILLKLYPHYPSSRQLAKQLGLSHTAVANKLREYQIIKK